MANIRAKIKNIKKINKATIRNRAIKSSTKKAIKKAKIAILNNEENKKELISYAKKQINVAVSKGVFHKNKGARKQSRLDGLISKHNQNSN